MASCAKGGSKLSRTRPQPRGNRNIKTTSPLRDETRRSALAAAHGWPSRLPYPHTFYNLHEISIINTIDLVAQDSDLDQILRAQAQNDWRRCLIASVLHGFAHQVGINKVRIESQASTYFHFLKFNLGQFIG